jgi:predicted metal-dependent HD superfamily phosphohydrolase
MRALELRRSSIVLASSCGPSGRGEQLEPGDLREVRCARFPPEIVLASGEVLFVAKREEAALDLFARVHGVPRVDRHDTWADLLEPYLDTDFSEEQQARTLERLAASGFPREEVAAIRALVGEPTLSYNSALWDWAHLGHLDVLAAMQAALPASELAAFYWRSMEIANRGRIVEPYELPLEDRLRLRWYDVEQWLGIPFGGSKEVLASVVARYAEPHRRYHDRHHLLAVLDGVASAGLEGDERAAATIAAWFHDAVYRPGSAANEEESAALLGELLQPLTARRELIARAAELICGTARPLAAETRAAGALADADLAILAEEASVYRAYAAAIRAEYGALDDASFRAGRAAFLREVLEAQRARGRLYHDRHPLHEELACENLAAELAALSYW